MTQYEKTVIPLNLPYVNDGSGSKSDCIVEQGNGNVKYIIYHNPENGGNRIVVSENSWDAHHDHGDYRALFK